ncbi:hydroxysqualene dehydroxylase HpnE [Alienimonas californiensis]|uniref:15-cis-phytoene desaturase n=1 Tax=Alienimonas californiensis TaxID=2527989 RepID=A0A517PA58_9PLAN|nr:hydroxysqualene dehydroxylase HpnE [Alienimonas californiensis]QDT16271.1 15-cis-phytoene desaturase [Alienimonas californiensis]
MTAPATDNADARSSDRRPRVLIVGGGLAGLAAAAALAPRGCDVTVLESRPRLGGRASSFLDKTTGERVDNCQHVAMGCCTNFLALCDDAGLTPYLAEQGEVTFLLPDGTVSRLSELRPGGRSLPAPLHLAASFAGLKHFTPAEKRRLAAGVRALAKTRSGEAEDFAGWLAANGQTECLTTRFWEPVLVSALSETPDRMNVADARKVIVDGFLTHPAAWRVFVPTVPLDVLYGEKLLGWLRSLGVTVRTGSGVRYVKPGREGEPARVVLRDGGEVEADHVVPAVPHHRAAGLFSEELAEALGLNAAARLETAAISSVHVWFDREITPLPHAVLPERTSQWVFNRTRLHETGGEEGGGRSEGWYFQVVISASDALKERPQTEVIDEVLNELRDAFPAAREATVQHVRMVTEHKAVFAPLPGHHALRPTSRTPHPRVHLAGDYTATGWPATMEGAVRSGFAAAESVLQTEKRPERIMRPDLPSGRLARWLGFASGSGFA